MKLKLEAADDITILNVTEEVAPQHAAILKAGLTKLFESGKKAVILDLTGASGAKGTTLTDILNIQLTASELGAHFVVVTPVEGIGHATTRQAGIELLKSPLGQLMATEARLQAKIQKLTQRKQELENALKASGMGDIELKKLRDSASRNRRAIALLERKIEQMLKNRNPPFSLESASHKAETIDKTLTTVLEIAGVLKVV